jgi:hypothetical protein
MFTTWDWDRNWGVCTFRHHIHIYPSNERGGEHYIPPKVTPPSPTNRGFRVGFGSGPDKSQGHGVCFGHGPRVCCEGRDCGSR